MKGKGLGHEGGTAHNEGKSKAGKEGGGKKGAGTAGSCKVGDPTWSSDRTRVVMSDQEEGVGGVWLVMNVEEVWNDLSRHTLRS